MLICQCEKSALHPSENPFMLTSNDLKILGFSQIHLVWVLSWSKHVCASSGIHLLHLGSHLVGS